MVSQTAAAAAAAAAAAGHLRDNVNRLQLYMLTIGSSRQLLMLFVAAAATAAATDRTSQVLHCFIQHNIQQLIIALEHATHCKHSIGVIAAAT
jgi:hypothetical protein